MSVVNTFFEKDVNNFTRMSGVDGCKSLMDLIIVLEEDRNKLKEAYLKRHEGNLRLSLSDSKNKILEEVAWEDGGNGGKA